MQTNVCLYCKNIFSVSPNWPNQKYCSKRCGAKGRSGKNKPDPYTVETPCKCGCGKIILNPDAHYRYRKFIAAHRNSNGTHPRLGLKESEEHVESRIKKSLKALNKKETCLESQLYAYLDKVGIIYEKQKQIGRTRPDAYIESLNLCLYADGTFWHSKLKDIERDRRCEQLLQNKGYLYLRLRDKNFGCDLELRPLQVFLLQYSGAKP